MADTEQRSLDAKDTEDLQELHAEQDQGYFWTDEWQSGEEQASKGDSGG